MRKTSVQTLSSLLLLLLGAFACGDVTSAPKAGSSHEENAETPGNGAADATEGAEGDAAVGDGDGDGDDDGNGNGDGDDDGNGNGDGDDDGGPQGTTGCSGISCSAKQFCNYADAACGDMDAASGQCEARPSACTLVLSPVCGCDGETYASDCAAKAAGTAVRREGACADAPAGRRCGDGSASGCAANEFCNYAAEAGGTGCASIPADGFGACEAKPTGCSRILAEVCGCDGKTYSNECTAHALGVSVAYTGACKG